MENRINRICNEIICKISAIDKTDKHIIVAIDGNCAAGKTTVANFVAKSLSADVIHMDDFYLPFELRTQEQMGKIAGNIDFDRLISQAIMPITNGFTYEYKPYNCKKAGYDDSFPVNPKMITIVEGAYSCHPDLFSYYDLKIFLSVSATEQEKRIICRNGLEKAKEFKKKWIPREHKYFETYDIPNICDLVF